MGNVLLKSRQVESMSELSEILRKCKYKSTLIGKNVEVRKTFTVVSAYGNDSEKIACIGIVSDGNGLKPQYSLTKSGEIIIGIDKKIYLINLDSFDEILNKKIESLFYEYKIFELEKIIIIVCEIDIYCLDFRLNLKWHLPVSLIVDYEITNKYVKIETEDGVEFFSTKDGKRYET